MSETPDLLALLADGTPLLDVRAPAEFARGSVPGAVNLPILNDEERRRVGITYKQQGPEAAVTVGHRLVAGELREARIAQWQAFARAHPEAWLTCWRGGQRSAIAQAWLTGAGTPLPRVPGGYKALRHACIGVLERAPAEKRWIVLGGRTGTGKTDLIRDLPDSIDLEGLARHRGSAFGAHEEPQPTPASFENALAVAYLQHAPDTLVLEDESRTIGRLALPEAWHRRMQSAPLAMLEVHLTERVANIAREYLTVPLARGVPAEVLFERFAAALGRIERRLGGDRRRTVQQALEHGFRTGEHEGWIELLLRWYYDPMYDHQLAAKTRRIIARGDMATIRDFLTRY